MLTYIEPCGWCSSSISSRKCPSNVDNSFEPCQNLSTSSLISTNDSISIISTNSLSYNKTTQLTSNIIHSSFNNPNDYYTRKRINELHERMDDIQIKDFLKFINYHLSLKKNSENIHINDLIKDLSNGHILIDLIEILSSKKLKRENGHTRFHSLINVQYVLDYLKLYIQPVNISSQDIISGNRKQILALLWLIMKIFNFRGFNLQKKNCFVENTLLGYGQDRSLILKWLNNILEKSLINKNEKIILKDFSLQTWINGYYLSLIIKYLIPLSDKYLTKISFDYLKELNLSNENNCFNICLNLSNYCFNTITIINYFDKTDKCLFKFFTELHKNILNILQTNYIEKLIQNNPYTKQIVDTISQTEKYSSNNDNEQQYLICIDDSISLTNDMDQVLDRRIENFQSNSDEILKEENITDNLQKINDKLISKEIENLEQQEFIQLNEISEESIPIVEKQNLFLLPNENIQLSKQIIIESEPFVNINKTEELLESIIINQDVIRNEKSEEFEKPIENNHHVIIDEKLDQINIEEQLVTSNNEIEQSINESQKLEQFKNETQEFIEINEENNYEKSEEFENNHHVIINEKLDQPNIEEQLVTSNNEIQQPINESQKSEQIVVSNKELEQIVDTFEEQKPILVSNEYIEQKPSIIIEEIPSITTNEILQPLISNEETIITSIVENEKVEEILQSTILSEEPVKIIDNKTALTSNEKLEQSIDDLKETKPTTVENSKLNSSSILIEKVEQNIENKPLETPSNKQTSITTVQSKPVWNNRKQKESSQIINEKPTVVPVENKSSINTIEKLEKPVVVKTQQPIKSNEYNNKSTIVNKKSTIDTRKTIPTASSNYDNQYSKISNEQQTQSIIIVKESEQRKTTVELPVHNTTTSRCSKYSDITSQQTLKANNESVQTVNSFKKQERSTVSNKKSTLSTISNERPKQSIIITEEIQPIPSKNTTKNLDQSTIIIQESTEEPKKSSTKNKKSRRSKAKKNKAKNSQQQSIIHIEQDDDNQPSSPSLIQEQLSTNIQNSSALQSRKSKKKKTVSTTTTTLVEKSSSPITSSTNTTATATAPNRNLFLVIKECIGDRKIIAFKCIFILVCLCCSIIILFFSQK